LRKAQGQRSGDLGLDDYHVNQVSSWSGGFTRWNATPPHPLWFWTPNGIHAHGVVQSTGNAHTREEAMQQLATNWHKWLVSAGLKKRMPRANRSSEKR
jgi:hypothetical protein